MLLEALAELAERNDRPVLWLRSMTLKTAACCGSCRASVAQIGWPRARRNSLAAPRGIDGSGGCAGAGAGDAPAPA